MFELAEACVASLFAGLMDAIVGGGGLILLPAMFTLYPSADSATLLGTNKCAAVFGTGTAALRFLFRVQLRLSVLVPALVAAVLGAVLGARAALLLDTMLLRRALPILLLLILIYTISRKDLGQVHRPIPCPRRELVITCAIALMMGAYDGLFGPGTGTLFLFLLVRCLGRDFLHAAAEAKVLNLGGNLGALAVFAASGRVWWQLGLPMLVANVVGSLIGTSVALRFGTQFVRMVFIVVVGLLVLRTSYDAYFAGTPQ